MKQIMNKDQTYDVVIIGAGINGLGIALEMSLRNIKTLVLDKSDIASGTSSASSKLIHGGLRYLKQGYFSLVVESLKEQSFLLKNAKHIVKPLPFIFPIYQNNFLPTFLVRFGFIFYDFLKPKNSTPKHRFLNINETLELYPSLKQENLKGSILYYDAIMNDARLCIELAEMLNEQNVCLKTYCKVSNIITNPSLPHKLECFNDLTNTSETYFAKMIVNCTGPWSDETLALSEKNLQINLAPNKGSHIITNCIEKKYALALQKKSNQLTFVIPWEDQSIIGTTETLYHDKIDNQVVDNHEIDSLLHSVKQYLNLKDIPIIASYCGIRPLVLDESKSLTSISRKEKIVFQNFILSVMGGKYTTYRLIAEKTAKVIIAHLHPKFKFKSLTRNLLFDRTQEISLSNKKIKEIETFFNINCKLRPNLFFDRYGIHILRFYEIVIENPKNLKTLENSNYIIADIIYSIRFEYAQTIADILLRRTPIHFQGKDNRRCVEIIANIFVKERCWSQQKRDFEVKKYYNIYK